MILGKFLAAVKDHGTACDVASLAKPLHDRAADLRRFDVAKRVKLASHNLIVSFMPAFGHRHTGNVIGSVDEKTVDKGNKLHRYRSDTIGSHTIYFALFWGLKLLWAI